MVETQIVRQGALRHAARVLGASVLLVLLGVAATSAWAGVGPPRAVATEATEAGTARGFDVQHYDVRLEPDIQARRLQGTVKATLRVTTGALPRLRFDSGELVVDAVSANGKAVPFVMEDGAVVVTPAKALVEGSIWEPEFRYHGAPRSGMEFHPERGEVYTVFSTSQWMVSIDAPDERASLDLRVLLPANTVFAGTGREISTTPQKEGRRLHHWRIDAPVPGFVYGFAAGNYREVVAREDAVTLRYLSRDLDDAGLRKVFGDTLSMLQFFSRKSGVAFSGTYSQALVAKTIGQEMDGLAVLSEDYAKGVLEGRNDRMLIAHEVAHQWWGVAITCQDWRHFWLNEGLANFMALAYMQQQLGDAFYQQRVEAWGKRVQRLKDEGKDKPLIFPDWSAPTGDDRAVVYIKGAYAFVVLRQTVGEDAFWRGIAIYTQNNLGRSTTTADLRKAMEQASGRDLSGFFAQWAGMPATAS
ncbi:M1 family aminopeptidase [Stenotrophomonas indicatrix]|uniref:M1 family aminopeptidase n=1 Tax=Stenotrophomonas indicatrix TaxID=2045451 RepID=UPI0028A7D411|nr:M1 family aminopeptidase [Stenotrophomonas indicatrix]